MDKVINKASRGSEVPLRVFLCEVGVRLNLKSNLSGLI